MPLFHLVRLECLQVEMAMIHRDYGRYHAYASVPDGGAGARSEL